MGPRYGVREERRNGGTEERTLSLQRTVRQFESVVEFATLEGKERACALNDMHGQ